MVPANISVLLLLVILRFTEAFAPTSQQLVLLKNAASVSSSIIMDTAPPAQRLQCDVSVCSNHWCKTRGSEAALAAFVGLLPENDATNMEAPQIQIHEVGCMGACEKGPNIRVSTGKRLYEINKVDGMPKVTSVLRDLLQVKIDERAVACLKDNLAGNLHLQCNELYSAIEAYDRALAVKYRPQEGVLLSMRSEAYLGRAFFHSVALDQLNAANAGSDPAHKLSALACLLVSELRRTEANPAYVAAFASEACRVLTTLRKIAFHEKLYRKALLCSLRDSLLAAELLPKLWTNPSRAAEVFSALSRFEEASACFEAAANAASDGDLKAQFLAKAKAVASEAQNLKVTT